MFSIDELKIIKCERALADLKQGLPIYLSDDSKNIILLASIEALDNNIMDKLRNYEAKLIISSNRSETLGLMKAPHEILCNNLSLEDMQAIALNFPITDYYHHIVKHNAKATSGIIPVSLECMKIIEHIPATCVMHTSSTTQHINGISIQELRHYREYINGALTKRSEAEIKLKTAYGRIIAYRPKLGGKEHYAIIIKDGDTQNNPLVRIHSSCFTGDLLASIRCDCRDQLHTAIARMSEAGGGVITYLNQEGRGIGLANKLRAYNLQSQGYDTVEANEFLGFDDDSRLFAPAAAILKDLNITTLNLLTNNPRKAEGLASYGLQVKKTVPHVMPLHEHIDKYYKTKAQKLHHKITF